MGPSPVALNKRPVRHGSRRAYFRGEAPPGRGGLTAGAVAPRAPWLLPPASRRAVATVGPTRPGAGHASSGRRRASWRRRARLSKAG